jgi:hypothetical protein
MQIISIILNRDINNEIYSHLATYKKGIHIYILPYIEPDRKKMSDRTSDLVTLTDS